MVTKDAYKTQEKNGWTHENVNIETGNIRKYQAEVTELKNWTEKYTRGI